jgi:peptidoglycan/xylan/chitin deacetylase (PgdA/CDA1 family)
VLREGFPVLSALGVPATVFVPSAFPGAGETMAWDEMTQWVGGPFEKELDCMTWDELRRLQAAGWEIGSHTRTHQDLPTLEDSAALEELRGSKEECEEEIGQPCGSLAYPFSSYDPRIKALAAGAGFQIGVILDDEVAIAPQRVPLGSQADRFELLRTGIYRHDGPARFLAKTSLTARRLRGSGLLRRLAPPSRDRSQARGTAEESWSAR